MLDFGDMGKATATMTLATEGNGTKVTWGFDTLNSTVERWFGLMFDHFIGPDYEKWVRQPEGIGGKAGLNSGTDPVIQPSPGVDTRRIKDLSA